MSETVVRLETKARTLVIEINRPQVRNALSRAVVDGLLGAFDLVDESDEIDAAVLTGAGGYFSAGMDMARFSSGVDFNDDFATELVRSRRPRKPLIAAVEGFALAGGLEVALACDLVVAGEDAFLGIPEVKRGFFAPSGALLRLPRRIPFHVAMEMALTGEPITAMRAYELGLVNRVVEPGTAASEAEKVAAQVCTNAPLAVLATKELVYLGADRCEEVGWARSQELEAVVFGSDDAKEGPRAFIENREPEWQAR